MGQYFFRALLLATLLTGLFALFFFFFPGLYPPLLPLAVLYFLGLGSLFHALLRRAERQRPAVFTNFVLASSYAKMFLHALFVGLYLFLAQGQKIPFVVCFLLLYFAFTVFDVVESNRALASQAAKCGPKPADPA